MSGTRILGQRIGAAVILAAGLAIAPVGSAHAASPGSDGKIAFWDGDTGQVYSVNPDGSDLAQLTHVSAGHVATSPAWSPDGTHLVFDSDLSGEPRLHVMAADGTGRRLVFQDQPGFRDFAPKYLPTGRSVVFARCKPNNGVCAIYSVRLDGTHLTALTAFKEGRREAVDFFAAPSPDGRRIAFTRFGAHGITSQVYVMRADGSHAHAITPARIEATQPNWSPDGRSITASGNCCRLGGQVYVMGPDGQHLRALTATKFPLFSGQSSYSPTGGRIAFVSNRTHPDRCCWDLFIMNADGTAQTPIPIALTVVLDPQWGPAPVAATR